MASHVEEEFKAWLSHEMPPAISAAGATGSRLQKVVEIGGEKPSADHGLSIALQADFPSKGDACRWEEATLPQLLGKFMAKFGPEAAYFTTLLESVAFH